MTTILAILIGIYLGQWLWDMQRAVRTITKFGKRVADVRVQEWDGRSMRSASYKPLRDRAAYRGQS
jgi:hypothetical protein